MRKQHAYSKSKERVFSVGGPKKCRKGSKVCLTFDAEDRKEFITGFRKRKNERRKKAQEEIISTLKEEKKRIKQEKRDEMKSRVKAYKDLRDIDTVTAPESYELADHTVTVTDVSNIDFVGQHGLMLGANLVYEEDGEEEEEDEEADKKEDEDSKSSAAKKTKTWKKKRRTNFSHRMDKHAMMKERRKSKKEAATSGTKQKPPKSRR